MACGASPVFARRRFAGERPWSEAPECEHGTWTFAGANFKRRATQWRCPAGDCQPKSVWIKATRRNPLLPHGTCRVRKDDPAANRRLCAGGRVYAPHGQMP
jgi:hypothetical protein